MDVGVQTLFSSYGWDGITRRGTRIGFEVTTGAVGNEKPVMFANAFVMWGPPRR